MTDNVAKAGGKRVTGHLYFLDKAVNIFRRLNQNPTLHFMVFMAVVSSIYAVTAIAQDAVQIAQSETSGTPSTAQSESSGAPSTAQSGTSGTPSTAQSGTTKAPYQLKPKGNTKISFRFNQYTWKEYNDGGKQLLKESGPLYGIQFAGEGFMSAKGGESEVGKLEVGGTYKINLFGGKVDYDGATQAGQPVETKTDYFGAELNANLAFRVMPVTNLYIKGFIGPEMCIWNRDINSTSEATGYNEYWFNFDCRGGIGLDYRFLTDFMLFAEVGYNIPIYTMELINLSNVGISHMFHVEPDQTLSPFAELGLSWKYIFISGFYDSLRFDKSNSDTATIYSGGYRYSLEVWQPESQADIWGINAGLCFEF
jgi:hypothetical protein